jgi:hypothetical protein
MDTQFASDSGDLLETVRALDADSTARGILVLTASASSPQPDNLDPLLRDLSVPVFGGVFPEILHEGEKYDTGSVLAALDLEPDVTVVPGLSDPDTQFDQLPEEVPNGGTAFVLVDAFADRIQDFVSSLFHTYGVDLAYIGGGAGSLEEGQRPCLFTNQGVVQDAAVLATVDTETSIGVKHGWGEIAGPLRVTESSGRTVSELAGEPALSVYRRIIEDDAGVHLHEDNFFDVAKSYPFGLTRLDGEKIVRDPYEMGEDGSLTCFGSVPEEEFVHVLKGDRESLVDAAENAYDEAVSRTDGRGDVFFFDCISRVLYLEDAFADELAAVGGSDSPTVGALTIGEIANDGEGHLDYYNKTAVTAVTEEI